MRNREEMLKDLHRRMDEYEVKQKMKRSKITKIAALVTPVCVAAAVGIGLWKGGVLSDSDHKLTSRTVESEVSDVILSAGKDNDMPAEKRSSDKKENNDKKGVEKTPVSTEYGQKKSLDKENSDAKENTEKSSDVLKNSAAGNKDNQVRTGAPAKKNDPPVLNNSAAENNNKQMVTGAHTEKNNSSVSKNSTSQQNKSGQHIITANDVCQFLEEEIKEWHQLYTVSNILYEALESGNDDDIFAILARPVVDYDMVYNGKTLAKYYSDMCDERNLPEILGQLQKEGDSLKYGDALYTTGTPDGEKWAQSLYEERTLYYGKALLSKYIVGGEFLRDKVEQDIAAAMNCNEATAAYNSAYSAYLSKVAASVGGELPAKVVTEKNGIIMYLTKQKFSVFSADRIEGWSFDLADTDSTVYLYGDDE